MIYDDGVRLKAGKTVATGNVTEVTGPECDTVNGSPATAGEEKSYQDHSASPSTTADLLASEQVADGPTNSAPIAGARKSAPWWREHAALVISLTTTALVGYSIFLSRRYCSAAGFPRTSWTMETSALITWVFASSFFFFLPIVVVPASVRWILDYFNVDVSGPINGVLWLVAICLMATEPFVIGHYDGLLLFLWAELVLTAIVVPIYLLPGRWPKVVGIFATVILVAGSCYVMWVSATNAGKDHAAGEAGDSLFSSWFVNPVRGTVNGVCMLRISSTIYVAADNHQAAPRIHLDESGPFVLDC